MKNVESGISPGDRVIIDATATFHILLPDVDDRMTLEDCRENEGHRTCPTKGNRCPTCDPERSPWEDAQVEEQNGDFDKRDRCDV